jgi:hypothetical protein
LIDEVRDRDMSRRHTESFGEMKIVMPKQRCRG